MQIGNNIQYDFIILGSGPAGHDIALKLSNLDSSLKICLIDENELGGVCLNRGCIPTKTMISASNKFKELKILKRYGIEILEKANFNFEKFKNYKNTVILKLKKGLENSLIGKNIDFVKGKAKIESNEKISVILENEKKVEFCFANLILATGSSPISFFNLKDKNLKNVINSEDFWQLSDLDINKKIAIIGGGVIGCEYSSSLADFGYDISIFEKGDRILVNEDIEISNELSNELKSKGVKLNLNAKIKEILNCEIENQLKTKIVFDDKESFFDFVIICSGRIRNLFGIGLENLGINPEDLNTNLLNNSLREKFKILDNVFLIGDLASGPQLAHKAYFDSEILLKYFIEKKKGNNNLDNFFEEKCKYENLPMVIFTNPEISRVGLTLYQSKLKFSSENINQVRVNFAEIGKAVAENTIKGFLVINYRENGDILGISIIGHNACEFSAISSLIISNKMKISDLQKIKFAHPTISEIFHIAADKILK
jgi:dihydrolipoamide dehydrogenase